MGILPREGTSVRLNETQILESWRASASPVRVASGTFASG